MKFTVSTYTLLNALRSVCDIKQCPVPILNYYLFGIEDGRMTIVSANLEAISCTELKIGASDFGCFALLPSDLFDTLKCLPEQVLTFRVNQITFEVEIISDTGCDTLSGADAEKLKREISERHPGFFRGFS